MSPGLDSSSAEISTSALSTEAYSPHASLNIKEKEYVRPPIWMIIALNLECPQVRCTQTSGWLSNIFVCNHSVETPRYGSRYRPVSVYSSGSSLKNNWFAAHTHRNWKIFWKKQNEYLMIHSGLYLSLCESLNPINQIWRNFDPNQRKANL